MSKPFFEPYTRVIPAGGMINLPFMGRFITLLENDLSIDPQVGIDQAYKGSLPKGLSVELPSGEVFKYIQIHNPSGSTMTITLALSVGRIYDNRLVISGEVDVDFTPTAIETPAAITLNAGNSYEQTIAADTDRKAMFLQNNGSNAFWAGDSNVDPTANRGTKVEPDEIYICEVTAAVTLKSNSLDCTISPTYLTRA